MKVAMPHERRVPMEPPIPLDRPVKRELEKGDYLVYKLRNDPADPASGGYDLTIPYFRDGTPEQFLRFRKNLLKVFAGQNVTDGPGMFTIGRRLMDGDALSEFENFVTAEQLTQTVNNFNRAMEAVAKHVFPAQAAKLQKRYLRRFVRKPLTMSVRKFVTRIQEINNYLPSFPPQVPGEPIQKLDDDEVIDLMEFGVPRAWQKKMEEHDFDSTNTTIGEFLAFCERMERIEVSDDKSRHKDQPARNGNDDRKRKALDLRNGKSVQKGTGKHYCLLHGNNATHDTDGCFTIKNQVEGLKTKPNAFKKREGKSKQELNAMTDKADTKRAAKRSRQDPDVKRAEELKAFETLSISDDDESKGASDDSVSTT